MRSRSFFRAAVAALAFSAACGDSTGPAIQLTEDQTTDMMEAFALISSNAGNVGTRNMGGGAGDVAMLVFDLSESGPCPDGGTYSVSGDGDINETTGSMTATYKQDMAGCKATSSSGRLWTFDGDPDVTTTMSLSYNEQTGITTMNLTQTGAFKAASDIGSGRCAISFTMSMTSNDNTGAFNASASGTICGRTMEMDLSDAGT